MATITRKDLVQAVAEANGSTAALAGQMLEAFLGALSDAIVRGHRIEIRGFGTFTVKNTNPRPGARNPRTGERVCIPARRKVMFPASWSGKIKMFSQVVVVGVLIFFPKSASGLPVEIMVYLMVAITAYSGFDYVYRARREIFKRSEEVAEAP